MKKFIFKNKIFKYPGMAAWFFVPVSKDTSEKIKALQSAKKIPKRGWGSVPVTASIKKTSWETSIFPDKKSGCFLLPIKKEVRLKEDVWDGDMVEVCLRIE
jgi:hypothetical protein